MDNKDLELTRRMLFSATIEKMSPRLQLFIPHVDGSFFWRSLGWAVFWSFAIAVFGTVYLNYLMKG